MSEYIKLKLAKREGTCSHELVDIDSGKILGSVRDVTIHEDFNCAVMATIKLFLHDEDGNKYS